MIGAIITGGFGSFSTVGEIVVFGYIADGGVFSIIPIAQHYIRQSSQ